MNQLITRFRYPFVFLLILVAINVTACNGLVPPPRVPVTELVRALKNGEVRKLRVNSNAIQITYNDGSIVGAQLANKNDSFEETMRTFGVTPEQLNAAHVMYENFPFDK